MRQIIKKISLEPFISRIPGILPSLGKKDGEGFIDFSNNDILTVYSDGNYGMIASDIEIPQKFVDTITDYTDLYVNIPNKSGGFYTINRISKKDLAERAVYGEIYYFYYNRDIYSIYWNYKTGFSDIKTIIENSKKHKYLTYNTLHKWLADFREYKKILNSSEDNIGYKNAMEYYKYEVSDKDADTEDKYRGYDELFLSRGGEEFFDWLTKNVSPIYHLPKKYTVINNFGYLYYPEAVRLHSWLKERYEKYGSFDTNGKTVGEISDYCKKTDNCCDCAEYFNKGGNGLYLDLDKWVNEIGMPKTATRTVTLPIPLLITSNIDDIGEMSIFSNRYKEKVNYEPTITDEYRQRDSRRKLVYSGGTIIHQPIIIDEETGDVSVDDNTYIIKERHSGYTFNEEFQEARFDKDAWDDYAVRYINSHKDEFMSAHSEFAFNRKGTIIFDPNTDNMAESYGIKKFPNGVVYVGGKLYTVDETKYVEYNGLPNSLFNGKKVKVNETSDGNYFTQVGDKTFFAKKNEDGTGAFNFKKPSDCDMTEDDLCEIKTAPKSLYYNNTLYIITDDNYAYIENEGVKTRCDVFYGYVEIDDTVFYVKDNSLYSFSGETYDDSENGEVEVFEKVNQIDDSENISVTEDYVNVTYPYTKYECDLITGHTDSKLESLKIKRLLTDDLGNEMPGYYDFLEMRKKYSEGNKPIYYSQPYNGCQLDLYYKVGTVNRLSLNEELTTSDKQYLNGDILEKMEFFYMVDEKKCDETVVTLCTSGDTDNLSAIASSTEIVRNYVKALELAENENTDFQSYDFMSNHDIGLYCTFTYYLGAVLEHNSEKSRYELSEGQDWGVKYFETDELVKKECTYKLIDGTKMVLNYYDIRHQGRVVRLNAYDDQLTNVNDAVFVGNIKLFKEGSSANALRKSITVAPVFRKEYQFGNSFPQNIKPNIYIDRGVNRALDKHLRLQEISTMDALEQYQNGAVFNITEI